MLFYHTHMYEQIWVNLRQAYKIWAIVYEK